MVGRRGDSIRTMCLQPQQHVTFKPCGCKAQHVGSPPGYPPSRLLITVNWPVNWFACVQRSTCTSRRAPPSSESHVNPTLWIVPTKLVVTATSVARALICSRSCANLANLAMIGPLDAEIIGLKEIVKNKETKTEHKPAFGCVLLRTARAG